MTITQDTRGTLTEAAEGRPSPTAITPARSDRMRWSPFKAARKFWQDQVYLNGRLLAAQRPWDESGNSR
jgi:hypothetical protein